MISQRQCGSAVASFPWLLGDLRGENSLRQQWDSSKVHALFRKQIFSLALILLLFLKREGNVRNQETGHRSLPMTD